MLTNKEIDALVADKIMGWKFQKPFHGTCCCCQNCGRSYDECQNSCEYSSDIDSAWEVVKKLDKQFPFALRHPIDNPELWEVVFGSVNECATEVTVAICLAGIKALKESRC